MPNRNSELGRLAAEIENLLKTFELARTMHAGEWIRLKVRCQNAGDVLIESEVFAPKRPLPGRSLLTQSDWAVIYSLGWDAQSLRVLDRYKATNNADMDADLLREFLKRGPEDYRRLSALLNAFNARFRKQNAPYRLSAGATSRSKQTKRYRIYKML